jgi:hypothetical protein
MANGRLLSALGKYEPTWTFDAGRWRPPESIMTVPIDFKTATSDFDKFLLDARETCGLTTTNQVWGVLLGVFDVFRRRLTRTKLFSSRKHYRRCCGRH